MSPASMPGTPRMSRLGNIDRGALVTIVALVLFVALRLHTTHGAGGYPVAGAQFVGPDAPSELHRYASSYDGQFVYRFALGPFTRSVTAHGITLDLPAYRQQRIATSTLAYLIALLPIIGTAVALIMVNLASVAVAAAAAAALVRQAGRSAFWAPVLAIPACVPISLGRDLTEPLAWSAILVAFWAYRANRCFVVAVALTVAVLARETSLLVVAGLGLSALPAVAARRPRAVRAVLWIAVPAIVELGWQVWLEDVWGEGLPMFSGATANGGRPLLGVLTHFATGLRSGSVVQRGLAVTYLVERTVLIVLIAASATAIVSRRARTTPGEALSWLAAISLALSLRNWGPDVAFLRATYEAWGLSVLVLIGTRARWADRTLGSATVVTAAVAVLYTIRV